jgi:UDP-GlcNAc:undecaprenyl-phosphate/decaprenyl-phosphate GlcNAc-1-phosphate transferase
MNRNLLYLLAAAAAAAASSGSVPLWRKWCSRHNVVDDPGHRKIHSAPVPLAGGLAVFTGLFVSLLLGAAVVALNGNASWANPFQYGLGRRALELAGVTAGGLGMLLVGLCDDQTDLRPAQKFCGQVLAAFVVAACGARITLFVHSLFFSYAITMLWILTLVNALNFMDNMNGLCAGLGLIGAAAFGFISAQAGQYLVAMIAFIVAGALAGFLPFNFPQASAFLGDAGSHLVGYLLAVLAILPHFYTPKHPQTFAVLTPLFVLAVPLADLAWVVVLRWRKGKPFYMGDTNHLSHRLTRQGLIRTMAVLVIWTMSTICAILGVIFWR